MSYLKHYQQTPDYAPKCWWNERLQRASWQPHLNGEVLVERINFGETEKMWTTDSGYGKPVLYRSWRRARRVGEKRWNKRQRQNWKRCQ
jgi:hypothetical protein